MATKTHNPPLANPLEGMLALGSQHSGSFRGVVRPRRRSSNCLRVRMLVRGWVVHVGVRGGFCSEVGQDRGGRGGEGRDTHTHRHTDTWTHGHTDTRTHGHTDTRTQTHTHTHKLTQEHTKTRRHEDTNTQTREHAGTHRNTQEHTGTHTHREERTRKCCTYPLQPTYTEKVPETPIQNCKNQLLRNCFLIYCRLSPVILQICFLPSCSPIAQVCFLLTLSLSEDSCRIRVHGLAVIWHCHSCERNIAGIISCCEWLGGWHLQLSGCLGSNSHYSCPVSNT